MPCVLLNVSGVATYFILMITLRRKYYFFMFIHF